MAPYPDSLDIRIGTLVSGNMPDPAAHIAQLLPYGFESISLTFWQTLGGKDLPTLAQQINDVLAGTGVTVSSVSIYGNPLENRPLDVESLHAWEALIEHAHLFGTDLVTGFTGRLRSRPIPESLLRFGEVFSDLALRAADRGVSIAFENCDMDGSWLTGDWNIAHNPVAWEMMFNELPGENVGLEWEPCHQMVNLIDPIPQLRKWVKKIFHVHGKDATIKWDVIRQYGIGGVQQFAFHRTPGFGDTDWADVISELRWGGYHGAIDIEGYHDPVYRGELEMTGQVAGLNYLKRCRGGEFVPNPSTD